MGDFFDEVDASGIIENHIQSVLKLEDSQANKLLRRYKEVRVELRDRLDRMPINKDKPSFSAQQLRGVLAQIDGAITAMNQSLQGEMADASLTAALSGVKDQLKEIKFFEKEFLKHPLTGAVVPINLNVQLVAEDTSNFLMMKYNSQIEAYGQDIRSNLIQVLTNESLAESPYSTVIQKLGAYFQGEEWKLHRLARTELHNIYNLGKLNGMKEVSGSALPDLKKTLFNPMDNRTASDSRYVEKLKLIVDLDQPFIYTWNGKRRSYMVPPDRPNDRSILVPYRQAWDSQSS
jgi:hypothetical protein